MAEMLCKGTDRDRNILPRVGSIGGSGSEIAMRMTAASWREHCSRKRPESDSACDDYSNGWSFENR